ncbi:hypothetical protein C1645_831246 [Glomus cerebriforme]|uniref:F-box domain-containing protein n=1 Tax=Glomus cerebriforme TaxID=658196 RepID=A0A397SQL2_9GLOM|nr:hypothetical protein C1645_831246 [Glomus cerebriforme]
MFKLNKDVLFLIFEELQDNKKFLYSCLRVNKTWCETIVPILWKYPTGKYSEPSKTAPGFWINNDDNYLSKYQKNVLFYVILLHLSEESRNYLENRGFKLFGEEYREPSFNYIRFWRHLNLHILEIMLNFVKIDDKSIVREEILKLFVNRNTKFISLTISSLFDPQKCHIPGANQCLSELESFYCNDNSNEKALEQLSKICHKIKRIRLIIIKQHSINSRIVKLIKAQRNLNDVQLICRNYNDYQSSLRYRETLEETLIKNANTIRYLRISWLPITNILSCFVNLINLDIEAIVDSKTNWINLKNVVSLPYLKVLKANQIPLKLLTNIIESTKGYLTEISILNIRDDKKYILQKITQYCPNLKYLKILLMSNFFLELENLLLNCKNLQGLVFLINGFGESCWDNLFKILIESSPINLFKFKFRSDFISLNVDFLESFFDNWKDRPPMFLHFDTNNNNHSRNLELQRQRRKKIKNLGNLYKKKGIIKHCLHNDTLLGDFEWI